MKTINIKSRVNKIDKWFKSIGKKILERKATTRERRENLVMLLRELRLNGE